MSKRTKLSDAILSVEKELAAGSSPAGERRMWAESWYRSRVALLAGLARVIEHRTDGSADLEDTQTVIQEALLRFGSSSEDNVRAVQHLRLRQTSPDSPVVYELSGTDLTLVQLLDLLSSVPVEAVVSGMPADDALAMKSVGQEQWEDAIRLLTLLVIALEG
ncbi:MAG: hypothetical protein K8H88_08140 [Sandaracinaceae bacterium]|nr:hypothetical protein [Sandaracinaceae bacterium]